MFTNMGSGFIPQSGTKNTAKVSIMGCVIVGRRRTEIKRENASFKIPF
jgi:hypothetical protein